MLERNTQRRIRKSGHGSGFSFTRVPLSASEIAELYELPKMLFEAAKVCDVCEALTGGDHKESSDISRKIAKVALASNLSAMTPGRITTFAKMHEDAFLLKLITLCRTASHLDGISGKELKLWTDEVSALLRITLPKPGSDWARTCEDLRAFLSEALSSVQKAGRD
jgi:hypothetical protein